MRIDIHSTNQADPSGEVFYIGTIIVLDKSEDDAKDMINICLTDYDEAEEAERYGGDFINFLVAKHPKVFAFSERDNIQHIVVL